VRPDTVLGLSRTALTPAHGIAAQMDFGGEPAARTAKCLNLNPACFAGGAAMRPDRCAVDHLQRVQFPPPSASPCNRTSHTPDRQTPAAELPPDRVAAGRVRGLSTGLGFLNENHVLIEMDEPSVGVGVCRGKRVPEVRVLYPVNEPLEVGYRCIRI
jgi:hypothetical protein